MKIKSLWKHLKVINTHKYYVTILCFRCGLYKQGILHDLSKYSFVELRTGMNYYHGQRSPNSVERATIGYSKAWLHHKGRNKHHWEYWTDFGAEGLYAIKMPICYVVEMFCDRVAATKTYLKEEYNDQSPLAYYQRTRFYYSIEETTDEALLDMLVYLSEHGLDQTIQYIKKTYIS